MTEPTHARLIPVTGPNDRPGSGESGIEVQFNPTSLKVSLANTLKANRRGGSSRAAQYVDKSSSSLSVELIFDTTRDNSDVRRATKEIAEEFMKPVRQGNRNRAPKRCLFKWGAFEFVGLMESFEETLDFFAPEGIPLRATLSVKLSEDRFQFRSDDQVQAAARDTPTLTATGADPEAPEGGGNPVPDATRDAGQDERDWRNTAMYNGVESPRFPGQAALAVPNLSVGASLGASVSVKTGLGASGPGFRYGASASVGTQIAGAFEVNTGAALSVGAGASVATAPAAGFSAAAGADLELEAGGGGQSGAGVSAGVGFG